MTTDFPEIKSSDLKAALDFLTGAREDLAAPAPPVRVKRTTGSARPVVAVHHGINPARIRAAKAAG